MRYRGQPAAPQSSYSVHLFPLHLSWPLSLSTFRCFKSFLVKERPSLAPNVRSQQGRSGRSDFKFVSRTDSALRSGDNGSSFTTCEAPKCAVIVKYARRIYAQTRICSLTRIYFDFYFWIDKMNFLILYYKLFSFVSLQ